MLGRHRAQLGAAKKQAAAAFLVVAAEDGEAVRIVVVVEGMTDLPAVRSCAVRASRFASIKRRTITRMRRNGRSCGFHVTISLTRAAAPVRL